MPARVFVVLEGRLFGSLLLLLLRAEACAHRFGFWIPPFALAVDRLWLGLVRGAWGGLSRVSG